MPTRSGGNPADFVLTARLREPVRFTDLSERMALKLSALPGYLSRAHFDSWHRRLGAPDFASFTGVFTPLYQVEVEVTDVALAPRAMLLVRGHSHLARVLDAAGETRHVTREGIYTVSREDGALVGRARFVNVFTRYDPDPAQRRVAELPAHLGLGRTPSRVIDLVRVDRILPVGRPADFAEDAPRVWHYTQTDPNRHVNGMEYLRSMEDFVSCALAARGHDLRGLFPARARLVYRKPCFRGEGYRRLAWFRGEAPLQLAGAFRKADDAPDAPPAVAVELTLGAHEAQQERA
ncbi:MAG: hypothetical protein AB1689_28210 [Thermodesulfobacteriota bacterium]